MLLLLSEGGRGSARGDAELGRSTEGPAGCHDRVDGFPRRQHPPAVPSYPGRLLVAVCPSVCLSVTYLGGENRLRTIRALIRSYYRFGTAPR